MEEIKEINYLTRYLDTKQKHRNLLLKHEATIVKYDKEIARLKYLLTKPIRRENEDAELTTILEAVCSVTEIIPHDILAQNRQRHISIARHLFSYVAYTHYGYTLVAIGRFLIKDHSTVIHSINTFQNYLDCNYKLEAKYYEQCKRILSIGVE
ncbi:Chromosomal replication initiator, DnaA C-terminal [uncultured Caudovirales phage]|uniref:Chromosomal replication initiator, DnaA C-terminal n=1 Tax=uncultured Caudovirales phage TaxID=2100421 RepID=A0A6J5MPW1_9CAUD|nr:Chromosomal replication initiator, DnaA C-terminal [uncultured Caudovirales phage]